MDAPRTLGQVIRSRRLALGLTQEELAERIGDGVRQAEVSRLECDRVALPRRRRLVRIASALELPVGELLACAGWAGAEEAFRAPTPPATAPARAPIQVTVSHQYESRMNRAAGDFAELRAAIARSREIHERTAQLLQTSTSLAESWYAGRIGRSRQVNQ